ncbi:unnamed protein product [Moneuplotes crassus]|uniref:Uncharacterized protein n=1 Tax=Euplotes crassus TaxID=5936 RepID=A0AAD1USC4_EUPCR|nr:unnamed protein product [Moneuplotes crassus]
MRCTKIGKSIREMNRDDFIKIMRKFGYQINQLQAIEAFLEFQGSPHEPSRKADFNRLLKWLEHNIHRISTVKSSRSKVSLETENKSKKTSILQKLSKITNYASPSGLENIQEIPTEKGSSRIPQFRVDSGIKLKNLAKVEPLLENEDYFLSSPDISTCKTHKGKSAKKNRSICFTPDVKFNDQPKFSLNPGYFGEIHYEQDGHQDPNYPIKLRRKQKKYAQKGVEMAKKRVQEYNQPDDHSQQLIYKGVKSKRKSTYEKNVQALVNVTAVQFTGISAARLQHLLTRRPREEYTLKRNFKWDFH